ncbi:MFS transporter [Kutzneria buriramensis]|uniref:MFS transporter n=1 Tax=Kutzneria buriramensis TaxID=1045776 RepID=A0A3E0HGG7_9PSEU|nr:MFS transporter [Kutzneria buriramensis]REH44910.1 MFS transporter [Kutzneria buriramensis]
MGVVLLLVGLIVSRVGDNVAVFGLVLDAAHRPEPWAVALVYLAGMLPPALLAKWLGRQADRLDPRRTWLACLVVQAATFTLAGVVNDFPLRVLAVAVGATMGTLGGSVGFKLLNATAGEDRVSWVNGVATASNSLSNIIGPALGGLVYAVAGSTPLLLGDGLSFLVLAGIAVATTPPVPRPRRKGPGDPLVLTPLLRLLAPVMAAIILGVCLEGVAGIFYLREVLHGNDIAYGLLLACWPVGSLAGALLTGRRRFAAHRPLLLLLGGLTCALGILLAGAIPFAPAIAAAFVLGGLGNGTVSTTVRLLIHEQVPETQQGQAWARWSGVANACSLVAYFAGTPWGELPPQAIVIISGAFPTAVAVVGLILFARRRTPVLSTP